MSATARNNINRFTRLFTASDVYERQEYGLLKSRFFLVIVRKENPFVRRDHCHTVSRITGNSYK